MVFRNTFSAAEIAATGLRAERIRMEVSAMNLANAHATRTPQGGPYRRQQPVFAAAMQSAAGRLRSLGGVEVAGVEPDESPFPRLYEPGHPDADGEGFVELPNVSLPLEMVDLLTASRSYEANLKSLETFRKMVEQTLDLIRSTSG